MPRSATLILLLGLLMPPTNVADSAQQPPAQQPRNGAQPGGLPPSRPGGAGYGTAPGYGYGYGNARHRGQGGVGQQGAARFGGQRGLMPAWPRKPSAANRRPGAGQAGGQAMAGPGRRQRFLLDASRARAKEGRVPDGFGQLGLSQTQRERIYGIRALYDAHVTRLEKLIERLEAEELLQCQTILTPFQNRMYQRYAQQKEQGQ